MGSKGEEKIASILIQAKIQFKREVSFKNLKGFKGKPLRFDFVLYKNNKIICCIDYDGIQHFEFTKFFYKNYLDFRQAQERDRIKNSFCLKNKIPFIRVPYWDFDNLTLEKILTDQSYRVVSIYHTDLLKKKVKTK